MGGSDNKGDGLASQPRRYRVPGQPLLNRHQVGGVSRSPDGLFPQQERGPIRGRPSVRGKRTYGGRPGQRVEEQGTWAAQKHSKAGYGWPADRGVWSAKTVKRPQQQPAHPQYANYWAPLTRKRHIPPHSAQSQHTNYWAPRTRKRHQQEHWPQRPTESSDPTQHAKGRTGDRPGPRKGATTRRNVTQGGVQLNFSGAQFHRTGWSNLNNTHVTLNTISILGAVSGETWTPQSRPQDLRLGSSLHSTADNDFADRCVLCKGHFCACHCSLPPPPPPNALSVCLFCSSPRMSLLALFMVLIIPSSVAHVIPGQCHPSPEGPQRAQTYAEETVEWLKPLWDVKDEADIIDMVNRRNVQLPMGHEIMMGRWEHGLAGSEIEFLTAFRFKHLCLGGQCGSDPKAAAPMLAALSESAGSLVGNDYRPAPVSAGYAYMAVAKIGIVYKIDLGVLTDVPPPKQENLHPKVISERPPSPTSMLFFLRKPSPSPARGRSLPPKRPHASTTPLPKADPKGPASPSSTSMLFFLPKSSTNPPLSTVLHPKPVKASANPHPDPESSAPSSTSMLFFLPKSSTGPKLSPPPKATASHPASSSSSHDVGSKPSAAAAPLHSPAKSSSPANNPSRPEHGKTPPSASPNVPQTIRGHLQIPHVQYPNAFAALFEGSPNGASLLAPQWLALSLMVVGWLLLLL